MKSTTFRGTRILRPFRAASGIATTRVQTAVSGQPRRIYMGMWARVYASTTGIPLMAAWDPTTLLNESQVIVDGSGLFRLTVTGSVSATGIGPPSDGTWFYVWLYADDSVTQASWAQYGRRFQTTILSLGSTSFTDQTQSFGNQWASSGDPAPNFGIDYLYPRFYRMSDESLENGGNIRLFAFQEMYSPTPTLGSVESNAFIDASNRTIYGNVSGANAALWSTNQYNTAAGEVPMAPYTVLRLQKWMANLPLIAKAPPTPQVVAWLAA